MPGRCERMGCCRTMILKMSDTISDDIAQQLPVDFNELKGGGSYDGK
jgi:hypothetical protein